MAIGLGTALLGSAIIGGGAAAIGASSNASAINSATNAQTAANQQSLALQKQVYDANSALLSPYVQRGNAAGDSINALLGLPVASSAPSSSGGQSSYDFAAYTNSQPDLVADWQRYHSSMTPEQYGQYHYSTYGANEGRQVPTFAANVPQSATTSPSMAQNAFNNYLNSAGYQFQLGEMNKAANAQFAKAGALDSGAAVKSAQDRAQNLGTGFFNNYLALLGNQQGVGLSGASAVAGVGQGYANNVTNLNTANANAIANGAMAKANNTNSLLGNLSSSFGLGMGALSQFGGGGGLTIPTIPSGWNY